MPNLTPRSCSTLPTCRWLLLFSLSSTLKYWWGLNNSHDYFRIYVVMGKKCETTVYGVAFPVRDIAPNHGESNKLSNGNWGDMWFHFDGYH